MFKWYGFLGVILIALVQLNFVFKIQPFADWYYPIIWFGYIFFVDALIYKLKKNSMISNRFGQFVGLLVLSVLFRYFFQIFTIYLNNWSYTGGETIPSGTLGFIFSILKDSIILPAIFETIELFVTLHLFDKNKLKRKYKITKKLLYMLISIGVICFVLPFIFPKIAFPLVWVSLFFILDPINYIHKQPSIIGHLKDRKLKVPLSIFFAGIFIGFLWQFWNYWSAHIWAINIPLYGFLPIFGMPILGYLGYAAWAFELYTMYWFARSLFIHKEHLLE